MNWVTPMVDKSNPLVGLDHARPLPEHLSARLERTVLEDADATRSLLSGIDAPRPLPAHLHARLLDLLARPRWPRASRGLLGAAAAVLLVALVSLGLHHGTVAPTSGVAEGRPGPASAGPGAGLSAGGGAGGVVGSSSGGGAGSSAIGSSGQVGSGSLPGNGTGAATGAGGSAGGGAAGGAGGTGGGATPTTRPPTEPPPTVTSLTPRTGPSTGGVWIEISGSGFRDATRVAFGSTPATRFMVVSDSELLALSPPHSPGRVDVIVTGPGGPSRMVSSDSFTYAA